MFTARCKTRGGRVVLGLDSIRAIKRLPQGAMVEFECLCGETELVTVPRCR